MTQIIAEEDGILHREGIILGSFAKGDKIYKQETVEIMYCTEEEALNNGLILGLPPTEEA
jgi:hypothetical protein